MVAQADTQSHPFKAAASFEALLTSSAGSFPQSFPLLDRNFSNASTFVTDISEAAHALAEEQRESLRSMPEGEEAKAIAKEQTEAAQQDIAEEADQLANGQISSPAASSLAAFTRSLPAANGEAATVDGELSQDEGQQTQAEVGLLCENSPGNETSRGGRPKSNSGPPSSSPKDAQDGHGAATPCGDESELQGLSGAPVPLTESKKAATDVMENGDKHLQSATLDEKLTHRDSENSSGSSLSAESEPFVPSAPSSQQATPRGTSAQKQANGAAAGRLNANAASFVPSFGAPPAAGSEVTPSWRPPQLQFGSLPESLTNSPLLQQNGHGNAQEESLAYTEHGSYGEDADWAAWQGHQDFDSAYDSAAYTDVDGSQYYQQPDGTWLRYWPNSGEEAAHWQGGYDSGYPTYEASAGEYYHEDGHASGRMRRSTKPGKRAHERRREGRSAWQAAVLHVLESQFSYSRESLQEMLELHEGNLEVALDMLAQLEAEMDGQLPASGQDAPELNEENFPSLSSSSATSPALPASKAGFAKAVASPASVLPPATAPKQPFANGASAGTAPGEQTDSVPWKETGAAVSEMYGNARSVARDHARLRNMFFQEATKAFMAGQKALAKELSAQGREQSELMKAAHAEASQAIYRHRNPTSGRGGRSPGLIDLHGLHVKEAVAALEDEIASARRSRPKTSRDVPVRLSVLVGTGSHTKGSRTPARLPAAIENYLQASQIPFTWPSPGLLELTV